MVEAHVASVESGGPERPAPHIVLVVNVDWFFLSHRLAIALAAQEAGYQVTIAAADTGRSAEIRSAGLGFVSLPFTRMGAGPVAEARALAAIARMYLRLRPDLVHHVTIKPVLYGSVAARLTRVPAVVNAISGLGYVFTVENRARLLRRLVAGAYRYALRHPHSRTIFQNDDDRGAFIQRGLVPRESALLVRGSGVDCCRFDPRPADTGTPIVMLPARLLWDKGVGAFVGAARILLGRGVQARFVLVGEPDPQNPTGVPRATLDSWISEGIVEWWGHRSDMPEVLGRATIVTLPSHREGLPKVLLEAAAAAKPLVATDVPGCREVVLQDRSGLLVPVDDPVALAGALDRLLKDPGLRERFGAAARELAIREFREEIVVERTLAIYEELIGGTERARPVLGGRC